jgi:hypothetical protein
MKGWHRALAISCAAVFSGGILVSASAQRSDINDKDQWPVLTDEERNWTKSGLNAVLLYREEHSDLPGSFSTHFYRIKILNHEGREYGDVKILYAPRRAELKDLQARTIQPDGSIVPFQGQVFDKTLLKMRKTRLMSRSFSFPDVQAGSILEYRYQLNWKHGATPYMRWTLDHDLATRRARFTLKPYGTVLGVDLNWMTSNTIQERPALQKDGNWQLEVRDLPPFHAEELMPPEEEVRPWLEFSYEESPSGERVAPVKADSSSMLDSRWTRFAVAWGEWAEKFMDKDHALRDTVAAVTAPTDPPETRLRKLYERVEKIRNLSYQPPRESAEQESFEENKNVEDVLRRGYAEDREINILFAALARAAGFKSWVVLTADRETNYFAPVRHRYSSLTETLALVDVGGQEHFYDPGTLYCPFDTVSWEKTGMRGLRLVKGGGLWVGVPFRTGGDTQTRRIFRLHHVEGGVLEGSLKLLFTGQDAIRRRQEAYDDDDLSRSESLEEEVKGWLPDGSSAEVVTTGPWDQSEPPLEAELHVRIVGIVAHTAHRMIVPLSVLWAGALPTMYHPGRTYDVDLQYAHTDSEEVHFQLPKGYELVSLPAPHKIENESVRFETTHQERDGEIVFERLETISAPFFSGPEQRTSLLRFFYATRIADEDRIVLHATEAR